MELFKIVSKLSLNDYIRLNFRVNFSKVSFIFLFITAFLFISIGGMSVIYFHPQPDGNDIDITYYLVLAYGIFVMIYLPAEVFLRARRRFNVCQRIQEEIYYEFTEDQVKITGESFHYHFYWSKIFEIRKVDDFLLIYQEKSIANIVSLQSVDKKEYRKLKEFIHSKDLDIKVRM